MKLNIISDLHIENGNYDFDFIESDLLIIAGDICNFSETDLIINFLKTIPSTQKTIFVLGNHEYLNNKNYINSLWTLEKSFIYDKKFNKNILLNSDFSEQKSKNRY